MKVDPQRMGAIAGGQDTVSDKIRALDAAGYARADIARFLGKRYQHVRNVLEDDTRRGGGYTVGRADLGGVQEGPRPFDREAEEREFIEARGGGVYRLVVRPDGSIFLPAEVAERLKAGPGGVVMAMLEGDAFKLVSVETAMEEARRIVAKYIPKDVSLVDSFLANRRRMWGEDDEGADG